LIQNRRSDIIGVVKEKGTIKVRCSCGRKNRVPLGLRKRRFVCPACGRESLLPSFRKARKKALEKSGDSGPVFVEIKSREDAEERVSHLLKMLIENVHSLIDGGEPSAALTFLETARKEIKPGSIDAYFLEYYLGRASFQAGRYAKAAGHFHRASKGFPSWDIPREAERESRFRLAEE
jgi:predicted RNA-binding Zn-ribbon protein involved in translation (DUF1610 family)